MSTSVLRIWVFVSRLSSLQSTGPLVRDMLLCIYSGWLRLKFYGQIECKLCLYFLFHHFLLFRQESCSISSFPIGMYFLFSQESFLQL